MTTSSLTWAFVMYKGGNMTTIKFLYNKCLIKGFTMRGHAGFSENGPDILCSALSATSQMTVNGIADWTGIEMNEDVLVQRASDGKLVLILPEGYYEHVVVQQLLKSFELYMVELGNMYPNNVTTKRKEENNDNTNI